MVITYNVTGEKRKSLVGEISQELNAQTQYLGAPTFAYKVGEYHIDKAGTVTGKDNHALIADLQGLHGFAAVSAEYDEVDDSAAWHDTCDREDRDEDGNWDGSQMPYYREPRYTEEEFGLGIHRTDPIGEDGMQASDRGCDNALPEPEEPDRLTIEMPLAGFTEETFMHLEKLVASKTDLIKKAIGADSLPIEQYEDRLRFPWFSYSASSDEVKAYTQLVSALCAMAKTQQRVNALPKEVENPRYALRCFLLRLGFIGPDYKKSRKLLLAPMEGNGAFKSKPDAEEAASI